jgi:SNF2 family DNA or RNA helicase
MEQSKIDFYNTLSDEEKQILKLAAFKATGISAYDLLQFGILKVKIQKQVKSVLDAATKHDLFDLSNDWDKKYSVRIDFMLYIYPELTDFEYLWEKIKNKDYTYFYHVSEMEEIRNCFYTLLFREKEYKNYEKHFISHPSTAKLKFYSQLIKDEKYRKYLCNIDPLLIESASRYLLNDVFFNIDSLTEAKVLLEQIGFSSKCNLLAVITHIQDSIDFFAGHFNEIDMENSNMNKFFLKAVVEIISGNSNEAFALFEKGLKMQRQIFKGVPLPVAPYFTFYYLITLLNMDTKGTLVLQKISLWIEKTSVPNMDLLYLFEAAIDNALNKKEEVLKNISVLLSNIQWEGTNMLSLFSLLSLYLAGKKPEQIRPGAVWEIVEKTRHSGYLLLAYEAAYVARSWLGDERSEQLFHEIAGELSYPPLLSQLSRQEDWEKSLNLLLGLKSSAQKSPDGESKMRVVYYFNPKHDYIQPVLQTRQVKGWSTGRNIALKSLFEGKTQGMTAQDIRISKAIKYYRDYYSSDCYEFSKDVFPVLVGHPYIFLANSQDIPVEFVAAQPIITVAKVNKGYVLSSDVKSYSEKIFLQKETNTRYKVYDLTPQQIHILQIIIEQKIIVPEAGKEKLITLLGTFSAQGMTVHSDLLPSESEQTTVKEMPADSRIRVQLLPFGDGLKAELFVKPFGAHPPYCKPGKGGKVLISNEKNIQLQVKRNLKAESDNETLLLNEIQSLESYTIANDLIAFDDPLDSLHLLDILTKYTGECVVEWPEGERYKIRGHANFKQLHLNLKSGMNWFDLQGELKIDENTVISLQQLLSLTGQGHNRFIELNPGEFVSLSLELKKQLDALRLYTTTSKNEVHLNKFASAALGDFFDNVDDLKADKAWAQFRKRLNNNQNEILIPDTLQAELRNYQEDGFRWMVRLSEWEGGACLADDMGLGKTVQTLALLLHRAAVGPALVVCPVSVIGNWISEAGRFAPTLRVKTLGNTTNNRQEMIRTLEAGDLLVTSYGLLQSEEKLFSEPSFATAVLDEAHAIKNYATKTSKASMQLKATFRIALTGTPVQNHLGEVWNLFNFANPGLLGSLQHFTDTFIKPDDEKTRKYLKKLITPFILRRTKSAVLDELPPKTEIVKKIQLSTEEMAFYEALRRQAIDNLTGNDTGAKQIQVLAEITKLRQASCNPLLIDKDIQIASSKLAAFLEIANELKENKHRALVFSQFVSHLSIVRKALDEQGVAYQYLDGSSSMTEREKSVRKFQNGEGDLFLISLKAGGLGLNLTAADYVIHLDPWWNPAIEDQASDRAHRIGQTRPVTIYRLVAENTIEEKIIQLHNTKRDLAESLLEGSDRSARMSMNELIALIKERD